MPTLRRDRVTFETICHSEDAPIEGNCSAIDPKTDRATERWIRKQLDRGNEWAWCMVEVRASVGSLSASDYLGCCSYRSREDFESPDGYYPQMCEEAYRLLCLEAERIVSALEN